MPENILLTLLCAPGTKKFLKILVYLRTNSLTFCVFLVHENNYWTPWLLTWPLATIKIQRKLLRLFETFHLLNFYSALLVTGYLKFSLREFDLWLLAKECLFVESSLARFNSSWCPDFQSNPKLRFVHCIGALYLPWPVFHNVTS